MDNTDDASNSSHVVACVFVVAEMFTGPLPSSDHRHTDGKMIS
jgi:hypothetical protein